MKIKLFLTLLIFSKLYSIEIISYGVDGKNYNTNVVIKDRNPIIFFEYDKSSIVKNFEIKLSTTSLGLISSTTIWYINQTTTSFNTINNITRIEIPSEVNLKVKTTYYLMITVYDISLSSAVITDTFYTTLSVAKLESSFIDIDYKNPFSPKIGEKTQIRYRIRGKDAQVKVCVFSISGRYLRTLADHFALQDMVYTVEWDGKDEKGEILPTGVYIISLMTPLEPPVTKLVGIVEKK